MKKKTRYLMVQGTASSAGKSRLVQALCRIFSDRGVRVAPFKAQNMSLNSAVTQDGSEIGRSTAEQAAAARILPTVEMNPFLLKPKSDCEAQLIAMGKPYGNFSAKDSYKKAGTLMAFKKRTIRHCLEKLSADYDLIVIEGAGSPAEINLRPYDIVNMHVARLVKADVLLVADIDRGGAIASLVGTRALLTPKERSLLKGFILNKFRGDLTILKPALDFLKKRTGVPVCGVIPFHPELVFLAEEDAVNTPVHRSASADIDIAVIYHPHISNFTDLTPLTLEPGVRVRYIRSAAELGTPDAIVIPGTKNTTADLQHMRAIGLFQFIQKNARRGVPVIGLCGGYQMLGDRIEDPSQSESSRTRIAGLGLLSLVTVFGEEKQLRQSCLRPAGHGPFLSDASLQLKGYEIHHGETFLSDSQENAFQAVGRGAQKAEGAVSPNGLIFGTYLHDIFTHDLFRRQFVNVLRKRKKMAPLATPAVNYTKVTDKILNNWARIVEKNVDLTPWL